MTTYHGCTASAKKMQRSFSLL